MSQYRTRNQQFQAVVESPAGTEGTPTPASNAIKVRNDIRWSPNFDVIQTDFVQASLSQSAPIAGGGSVGFTIPTFLRGSGSTGQTPVDIDALLRGCAMGQTITAAAVTGSLVAGSATTATLAAGASAVDDFYKGMPLTFTSGPASGKWVIITAYNGTTKVATFSPDLTGTVPAASNGYSIPANVRYRPVSVSLENLTAWLYQHHNNPATNSKRRRMSAGMGTFRLGMQPRGLLGIDFAFTGILPATPDDVAKPTAPTYQAGQPQPFINALAYLGNEQLKFTDFSFDMNNGVQQFDDPGALYGYDIAQILSRQATGRIVPNITLNSTRNAFSDFLAGTTKPLWFQWGTAAGSRVSLLFEQVQYTGNQPADARGFAVEELPFQSVAPDGEVWIVTH